MKAGFFELSLVLVLSPLWQGAAAWADTVILQNSVAVEGLAEKRADGTVAVQINADGYVYYSAKEVLKIVPASDKENAALQLRWRREERAAQEAEKEEQVAKSSEPLTPCLYPGPQQYQAMTAEDCEEAGAEAAAVRRAEDFRATEPAIDALPPLPAPPAPLLRTYTGYSMRRPASPYIPQ